MLKLTVCFDFVCPFCYLEHEALKQIKNEYSLDIQYLPFELRRPPVPPVDPMHDEAKLKRFDEVLLPAARKLGVSMKLPWISPHPYTTLAMQGLHYAMETGKEAGEAYIDSLFAAFYKEERDIGKPEVLLTLAEGIGLSAESLSKVWKEGRYLDRLDQEKNEAKALGVTGIPALFVNCQPVADPQTPEGLRTAFNKALEKEQALSEAELNDTSFKRIAGEISEQNQLGAHCGEDGCYFG